MWVSFSATHMEEVLTDLGAGAVWGNCEVYLEIPENHLEVPIEALWSNRT